MLRDKTSYLIFLILTIAVQMQDLIWGESGCFHLPVDLITFFKTKLNIGRILEFELIQVMANLCF